MLPHRLFPNSKYSIWVDSKSQLRRDPLGVLEALLWRTSSTLAISEHGARSSVYDEAKAVVKKNKATPEEVEVQLMQYRKDGLPEDKRFNGKKGMLVCSSCLKLKNNTDYIVELTKANIVNTAWVLNFYNMVYEMSEVCYVPQERCAFLSLHGLLTKFLVVFILCHSAVSPFVLEISKLMLQ